MKQLRVMMAVIAGLLTLPAASGIAAPKISSFELENGMQGVVIEDNRAPVVLSLIHISEPTRPY